MIFFLILTSVYWPVPRNILIFVYALTNLTRSYCYSVSSPRTRSIMTTRNVSRLHVTALISRLACCIHFLLRESFLDAFAKLRKSTIGFVMSVRLSASARPNKKTQLSLEEFLLKLILEYFSKIYREN